VAQPLQHAPLKSLSTLYGMASDEADPIIPEILRDAETGAT
jgi:hypothetical protein